MALDGLAAKAAGHPAAPATGATGGAPLQGPRRQRPLAVRLAAIIAVLIVTGLAAAGTIFAITLHHNLMDQVDGQLQTQIRDWRPDTLMAGRGGGAGPTQFAYYIFGPDGVQLTSLITAGNDPGIETFTPQQATAANGTPFTVTAEGGAKYRAITLLATDRATGDSYTLMLALPLDSVAATTRHMVLWIIWLTLAGGLIATAVGYAMVKRSLRPLRAVEESAAAIAAGDLSRRVPAAAPGTEVGSLTTSLNVMLTQIEASFQAQAASEARMRQFVSDASHELRTPLAALRGYAELYRMGALPGEEDVSGAMRRIEDEAKRMGLLVSDLLTLTRLDEGRPLGHQPVDLVVLAGDAAADTCALDPAREVRVLVDPAAAGGALTEGDESALRQVMTNLIGNAVRYTPAGSPIEIVVGAGAAPELPGQPAVWLEVRDHGPGVPPDKVARVFERFYRLDASRSRDSGGSGLGLAIVTSIVQAHGGTVSLGPTPGGGATFRVALRGQTQVPDGARQPAGSAATTTGGIGQAAFQSPSQDRVKAGI
ncbi:MAG: HAMP domain-containing histidine kinase [Bifidobacteriaceae bacterium]|jgi:two-component system OmpR family sensor kinase|nr:HAMP domain-containing histidine kinase [Bifidobacteriaceae bacterium]